MAGIFINRKNKYNNKHIHVLIDNKNDIYPFPTKGMASLFIEQNKHLEFKYQKFDSKLEFDRFKYLHALEKEKKISNLQMQVDFELIPSQVYEKGEVMPNGAMAYKKRKMRGTKYIADFTYEFNGVTIVEDTKSNITKKKPEYRIKKKLMLYVHNILVKEVDRKCVNKF